MPVTCDWCGESFGNQGALASHQNACDEEPVEQPDSKPAQPAPEPVEGGQAQPPAQQQSVQSAVDIGAQAGQLAKGIRSGDPVEKANAKEELFEMMGSAVLTAGKQAIEEEKQQAKAAKEMGGQTLGQTDDFPECGNCGGSIKHIPQQPKFDCPHCNATLEHPDM